MAKELKEQIKKHALSIARKVLETDEHIVKSSYCEGVSQEDRELCEEILLNKYHIKSLKFDGYEHFRVFTLGSCSESEIEEIIARVKPQLPEMEKQRQAHEQMMKYEEEMIKVVEFLCRTLFGNAVCDICCSGGFEKEPDEEEEDMTAN